MKPIRTLIMGAAGRDFHNFNVVFRDNSLHKVVGFTAAQITGISGRKYPPKLAGKLYPKGILIYDESELKHLIKKLRVDLVVFSYSDVSHQYVMNKASIALSSDAEFMLLSAKSTQLKAKKPVISICAVRTGSGKSAVTRYVSKILREKGLKVVVVRHPMPYGLLKEQVWQRFETYEDLDRYKCTIEEREEYEPHLEVGNIIYAGVDYAEILKHAEKEADVILWDGGNNDFPFIQSDLHIVLVDPHRPKDEMNYYPGVTNLRMADIILVNKENTASKKNIDLVVSGSRSINKLAKMAHGNMLITLDGSPNLKNKRVLVVEDGPTLTHGGMSYGAGTIAAQRAGAKIIDPRSFAIGSIKKIFDQYRQLDKVLPAMGYSKKQIRELERTINAAKCDYVLIGTPIDLGKLININKPFVNVRYDFVEKTDIIRNKVLGFTRK